MEKDTYASKETQNRVSEANKRKAFKNYNGLGPETQNARKDAGTTTKKIRELAMQRKDYLRNRSY